MTWVFLKKGRSRSFGQLVTGQVSGRVKGVYERGRRFNLED
ncbi:hypothetical protein EPIB2_673 [Tritonibacter mobilis]|nr:hypothetical protein EPIB2_673 [Tritonibacter mobilis]